MATAAPPRPPRCIARRQREPAAPRSPTQAAGPPTRRSEASRPRPRRERNDRPAPCSWSAPRDPLDPARHRLRLRDRAPDPGRVALPPDPRRHGDPAGGADLGSVRLPDRARRVRLLVLLGGGPPDAARGPLESRGAHLEGLLPDQHRPQGDRGPVRRPFLPLLPDRRPVRDADARPAGAAGREVRGRKHLQRAVLSSRDAADLPVRDPGLRGTRELRAAADDRGAGHGVPAPERALVLAPADRRPDDPRLLLRPRRLVRLRLDGLRAALDDGADRAGLLHLRRAV